MSDRPASELLRELDAENEIDDESGEAQAALWAALPALIAVVEKAEATVANAQLVCDEEIVLDAALADLRTQLGGGSA